MAVVTLIDHPAVPVWLPCRMRLAVVRVTLAGSGAKCRSRLTTRLKTPWILCPPPHPPIAPFAHDGCLGVSMQSARSDAALQVTK